jgi:hypothetical protein
MFDVFTRQVGALYTANGGGIVDIVLWPLGDYLRRDKAKLTVKQQTRQNAPQ